MNTIEDNVQRDLTMLSIKRMIVAFFEGFVVCGECWEVNGLFRDSI